MARLLGRLPAPDDRHLQRWSLTAPTMPTKPTSAVVGSNWYRAFFDPYRDRDGKYWLVAPDKAARPDLWGPIDGGHAYLVNAVGVADNRSWWHFYDQQRNDCVGYATARLASHNNRLRYSGPLVYDNALKIDQWPGEADEGTSVRAGMDVARDMGMWRVRAGKTTGPHPEDGILANRWAGSVEEMAFCLSPSDNGAKVLNRGWVIIRNSWGDGFPFTTYMDLETANIILFRQHGDCTVITDR